MEKRISKWFKNISIKRKLYFVMVIMALLILIELCALGFSIKTLSSVRAYVGGEGLWSKAQKNAIYYLQKYGRTRNEKDYELFKDFLKVPMGDAKTRSELAKPKPDLTIARNGFIEGKNHPDDVDGMIWLFRNFNQISYINRAIVIWGEAEPLMYKLFPIGTELNELINSDYASEDEINQILSQIDPIDQKLTVLEDEFSSTLGEGSRWLESLILKILFIIAISVEFTGLFLTISVSSTISKGIKEVVFVAGQVTKNDLTRRATIFSNDEIGKLAGAFNQMIDDLEQKIKEKDQVEEDLKEQTKLLESNAAKLEQSNKDLEQFAYVASHDLREPLRTINSYVQLIDHRYKDKLDAQGAEFIDFVVNGVQRMDILIMDLLSYSRVSSQGHEFEMVNFADVLETVITNSKQNINANNAKINIGKLPSLMANRQLIVQLFQNLINNAIKFHTDQPPEITISAKEEATHWKFMVKDNGIGIDKKYADRVFVIFQRLHPRETYEGTGIGLTICKKIVEHHGGKIWFESELNKGATFYFTIRK
jgi:signal transduction histidine kinase